MICALAVLLGCKATAKKAAKNDCKKYHAVAARIEYPDTKRCCDNSAALTQRPRTLDDGPPTEFWDLSLAEAISIALSTSEVVRDLGGRVISAPDGAQTVFDPSIKESDPLFGTEGALSAFDTQLSTSFFWEKNDRAINNISLGGGTREIVQDVGTWRTQLSKTAATGTEITVQNLTQYDHGNQPGNLFPSSWDTQFETSIRHPLMQGSGVTFNRIAGPNSQPGFHFSNGVLISRVNTDISLADFEAGVRDFISQIEDVYWDLYFAYRNLDARMVARDRSLATWRAIRAQRGLPGGTAEREARSQSQYYQLVDGVHDALNGTPSRGRSVGVYKGERRLRLLLGMHANDDRLIRPSDSPPEARVVFQWDDALRDALCRRVELRRQLWKIKRRELELIASRNFTMPRLDAIALYRFRGFGDRLRGNATGRFASALKDLNSLDHQEWQLGVELEVPLGQRQAWSGVRQAELNLARERAVLKEQELQISHGLSDAVAEISRAHYAIRTSYNRMSAALRRLKAAEEIARVDRIAVDLVMEAQSELVEAQTRYYQTLTEYAVAIKGVHYQKGTLLAYNGVHLNEGNWGSAAYADAHEVKSRWRPKLIDYRINGPRISRGNYNQVAPTYIHNAEESAEEVPTPLPAGNEPANAT